MSNNGNNHNRAEKAARRILCKKQKGEGVPEWPANAAINYCEAARLADQWLSIGLRKGEVKERLMLKYGVGARSCERVLSRARKIARARTGLTTEELRQRAHDVYQSIISSDESTPMEKVRAQARLDKLYGLQAPAELNVRFPVDHDDAAALLKDQDNVDMLDILAERLHAQRKPSRN